MKAVWSSEFKGFGEIASEGYGGFDGYLVLYYDGHGGLVWRQVFLRVGSVQGVLKLVDDCDCRQSTWGYLHRVG
jgi:hypothetical protein